MPQLKGTTNRARESKLREIFVRADSLWNIGQLRKAFRLFLKAAKAGDRSAQLNVGYFYDTGAGVRRNRSAALYWYRRAYRRGDPAAANNIGTIWRDEGNSKRALSWFQRAINLGDVGSNLEIAKLYLHENDPERSIPFLNRVCNSDAVAQATSEQARRLLRRAIREMKR